MSEFPATLFDGLSLDEGRAARDAALDQVEANADADWRLRATDAVYAIARARSELVADDLWRVIEKPREPRALGPVMRAAQREGWIAPTDRYRPNPNRHATPTRIWRSLVWEAG